jgi:hypothetical protein
MPLEDVPFENAKDVNSIQYRLHSQDVGFSLKGEKITVVIAADDDNNDVRVSYESENGDRRVVQGHLPQVASLLEAEGYSIQLACPLGIPCFHGGPTCPGNRPKPVS